MMEQQQTKKERALLLLVDTGAFDAEVSMKELASLTETAGGTVEATLIQKREAPEPGTYLGSGRLLETRELVERLEIDLVIADDELSPSQVRHLEDALGVRVIDRTALILDIFAGRARTSEGKLQVELAQISYSLPRLTGRGKALSRLGGGIGTRGPGESQLETDRRHLRRRMVSLRRELDEMEKRRMLSRNRRKKVGVETVAIVGYTNAGKSTLMNRLTDAGVLAQDKLFATLDPTARKLALPDGRNVVLVDTVGLIRRLPHSLVEAFHSTLEEAVYADVILNVCDASDSQCAEHLEVTREVLRELGCLEKPILSVMNKWDLVEGSPILPFLGDAVRISAKDGRGIDELLSRIAKALPATRRQVTVLLPYDQGALAARVRREGAVSNEEFLPEGVRLTAIVDRLLDAEVQQYVIPSEELV